jgi:hypothetical protein
MRAFDFTGTPKTKIKFLKPKHKYGYYEQQVRDMMEDSEWSKFLSWMTGQTVMATKAGKTVFFTRDVQRFLELVRNGVPTYWD